MSSIQSKIFGLLEKSSLPDLYKGIIRNVLPTMSRIQQEKFLMILEKEFARKQGLATKMKMHHWRYSSVLDRLEENPDEFETAKDLFPKSAQGYKKSGKVVTSTKKLSQLKSKLALQKLRGKM